MQQNHPRRALTAPEGQRNDAGQTALEQCRSYADMIDGFVARLTRWLALHPWPVLALTLLVAGSAVRYASHLKLKGDFVELLPSESDTAKRFHAALEKMGGGSSTLLVMVESGDAAANQATIDKLEVAFKKLPSKWVRTVEHGPEEARAFFERWRWLFADVRDLEIAECEINKAKEKANPFGLGVDDEPCGESANMGTLEVPPPTAGTTGATDPAAHSDESPFKKLQRQLDDKLATLDKFPTGYFRTPKGDLFAIMIRARSAGTGESVGDKLFDRVKKIVKDTPHANVSIGFGGDIPNAIAQREALKDDIGTVSLAAIVLILGSIILYFRSFTALLHLGLAVGTGTSLAFAAAMAAFGHLNAATSFLGSIIIGNGINYGIVYLGRYRERRTLGDSVEDALVDAAITCRHGTLLSSLAASSAYGALMSTSFRGFSEFGLIGGVGMLLCWLCTYLVCPASVSAVERLLSRVRRAPPAVVKAVETTGEPLLGRLLRVTMAAPVLVIVLSVTACVAAIWPLPTYLKDPWEYNFSSLGSKSTQTRGAGAWSRKANELFKSRGSPTLMIAESFERAPALAAAVLAADQKVANGKYVEKVETLWDRLGGTPEVVQKKLALLGMIRDHIDEVVPHMKDATDIDLAKKWRPPEYLRELTPSDLPTLVREQFTEKDGTVGRPVYVTLNPRVSQSRGENLLGLTKVFESVHNADGTIAANASRAAVFAAMIRSMESDSPKATALALGAVILVTLLTTRRISAFAAILTSLCAGVLWMLGGAAWSGLRLNFLNFVALPLTFGIGIEYAINLYDRISVFKGDIRAGLISGAGPVMLCSLTTILGYGSLLFADNRALVSFGRYAIAGEFACIIAAMVTMPAMLMLSARRQARNARKAGTTTSRDS